MRDSEGGVPSRRNLFGKCLRTENRLYFRLDLPECVAILRDSQICGGVLPPDFDVIPGEQEVLDCGVAAKEFEPCLL